MDRRESDEYDKVFSALNDDEKDDITGFTGREKKLIWASWKKMNFGNDKYDLNIHLVLWLFVNVPHMRERFDKFDAIHMKDEELVGDEHFLAHA